MGYWTVCIRRCELLLSTDLIHPCSHPSGVWWYLGCGGIWDVVVGWQGRQIGPEALDLRGNRKDRNRDWVKNRAKATENVGCHLQIIIYPVPRSLPSGWALPVLLEVIVCHSMCFVTFKRIGTLVLCSRAGVLFYPSCCRISNFHVFLRYERLPGTLTTACLKSLLCPPWW